MCCWARGSAGFEGRTGRGISRASRARRPSAGLAAAPVVVGRQPWSTNNLRGLTRSPGARGRRPSKVSYFTNTAIRRLGVEWFLR